jgi:probable FeS assembly SUF system protein SufT
MYDREPVKLSRDVEAVMIPHGHSVVLPKDTEVNVAQALGGSFTVYVGGNLARIAGKDADALGRELARTPTLPDGATDADIEALAWEQMKTCFDPEIPINIVDLGLVYGCKLVARDDGAKEFKVQMTLTAPGCGMGGILAADVKEKLEAIPGVAAADVELVFDPPWSQSMMSDAARLQTGMF